MAETTPVEQLRAALPRIGMRTDDETVAWIASLLDVADTMARALEVARMPPFANAPDGKHCSWCHALAEGGRCHHEPTCIMVVANQALTLARRLGLGDSDGK